MESRSSVPGEVRAVRGFGLSTLVVWVALASSRFEGRGFWSMSLREVAAVIIWALGLHLALRLVEALARPEGKSSWADYAGAYALMLFCGITFMGYFNAQRVGPLDAQWYQNVTTDYLTQARAGTFPVVMGSTLYAFNGAVHPFRSAPWQFVLADGIDILTGRTLAPVAVEHITAIASFLGAILILYVGFSRSRPRSRGMAWLFALIYATAPAATVPFFQFDMYMTMTAQPVMVAAFLCVQRLVDEDSVVAAGWLGVFLAALWYCHPPMALLTGMVGGACVAAGIATRGVSSGRLLCAAVCLAIFGALAGPYFQSMSELAQSDEPRLATLAMPLAGLALGLFAMAGFLRPRRIFWLALVPSAFLCLRNFQPSLVPFAGCFTAAMLPVAWLTRGQSRRNDVACVSICALAAAVVASAIFPTASIPGGVGSWVPHDWKVFFVPINLSGTRDQPGYLLWLLIAGMIALAFQSRSIFAQSAAAAALVLVVSLGFCGNLSAFLWRNVPAEINGVIGTCYDLRLVPVLAVVAVTGGFYWFASLREWHARLGRAVRAAILLLVPWMLWQVGVIHFNIRNYKIDAEQTAVRNRSENVSLERYSWDLLPPARYMSSGVMDPALETRFWSDSDHDKALIDPDRIEMSLETPGQQPLRMSATPIETGTDWLTLDPRVELDPGQHVLLRFDFLGKRPNGYLIVRGRTIYREYQLPSSGNEYAFGMNPGNTRTLSLWNSGATHESVQLLVDRLGPHAYDPPGPNPYCLMYLTPFDPKRAPIELYSLIPLRFRVDAPTAGYVESFRTIIPGYKVYVDGKPAVIHRSRSALVSFRVPPGSHDVWVRFAGTVRLHTAIRWAMTAWLLVAAATGVQLWTMVRNPARADAGALDPV
jgi:hypothetical protein